ncbi:hypothetical protein BDV18DRAFT_161059 [Aspergillus unguis]
MPPEKKCLCISPQTLCKACHPVYHHLLASNKFHKADLLAHDDWFSISFKRVFPASQRNQIPNPLTEDLTYYLEKIFLSPDSKCPQRPRIYHSQILHLPGAKNFEVRILVDIPPKWTAGWLYNSNRTSRARGPPKEGVQDDTRMLINEMLFCLTPGSEEDWAVNIPPAGKCASYLRLAFFEHMLPYLDVAVSYRVKQL